MTIGVLFRVQIPTPRLDPASFRFVYFLLRMDDMDCGEAIIPTCTSDMERLLVERWHSSGGSAQHRLEGSQRGF